MTVVVCTRCGYRYSRRSDFEEECAECGEEALVEEDAYERDVISLRCAECGFEVDGAAPGTPLHEESGLCTVDDPCPGCGERELVERDAAPRTPREAAEVGLARLAAARLLSAHWDQTLPVDVERIAVAEGLEVRRGSYQHDGLLVRDVIEVPAGMRQVERFVIAHELGHHHLRHKVPSGKIEQEANAFASVLLVPDEPLRAHVNGGAGLVELCRRFDVSKQVMTYALQRTRLLARVTSR
jgi:predicted RNA-binding Zn-ribbon protein involved in translation (DUF1610 family)